MMDIGSGNSLAVNQLVVILHPNSAPARRMRLQAKQASRLLDATGGKTTKSLVITASNHLILSNQDPETLTQAFNEILGLSSKPPMDDEELD
ncbi:MAG: DUF370 domain-containing protein [Deltaproteobacteria bacterium]|nr:DUF370 domain-containing protein [Deltaproteobacteria bacterium]